MKEGIMDRLTRTFRSAIAMLSVAALVLAFGPSAALAADAPSYQINLTGTTSGHTYEVYRIFTGDLSQDGETLSNIAWDTDSVTYNGTESAKDVAEKLAADSAADPGNSDQYIKQLEEKLTLKTPVKTVPSSAGTTAIDLSATGAGYYLVKDKDNSVDSTKTDAYTKYIVQVVGNVSVNVKSDVPNVYKKVKDTNDSDGTTSDWIDSADYDMGDWVPYQITGTMPTNIADYTTYSYAFTDTMSKGLTYDGTDADHKVKILLDDKTDLTKYFTEKAEKKTDGSTVVTWTCADLKAAVKEAGDALTPGSKICAYYSAQLNSKANIGSAGNPNTVKLTYSNNPNKGGEGNTGTTPEDKVTVFTFKLVVDKVDQDKNKLAGAEFTLAKKLADGTTKTVAVVTSDDGTEFTFNGLDDGGYTLTETKTPSGYNTIDPIEFSVTADHQEESDDPQLTTLNGVGTTGTIDFGSLYKASVDKDAGSISAQIVNRQGTVLPSTGGMGTTVLYLAGAAIIAAAGYGLYRRHRSRKQDA